MTPANLDAERGLLGALILDNFQRVHTSDVKVEHLYHEAHRMIYAHLVRMLDARLPVDTVSLCDALHQADELEYVGGMGYIASIVDATTGGAMARRYAEIVIDRAGERALLAAAEAIRALATEASIRPLSERQAEACSLLSEAATGSADTLPSVTAEEATRQAIEYAMARIDREPGQMMGTPYGVKPLDVATDGAGDGELIILAGRTSMGKSALALQSAIATARNGGHVVYFSLEMQAHILALRGISLIGGAPFDAIKNGRMTDDQYTQFSAGATIYQGLPLDVIEKPGLTVPQIAAKSRRMKYRHGLRMVIVDHLHLMPTKSGGNRAQDIAEITAGFQRLARELKVPVLLLAQLNREGAKGNRDGKCSPPTLTDLRDSGSIEQDADTVILLHREHYYNDQANPEEAQIIIAKNRNGERQTIHCGWDGPRVCFKDSPASWAPSVAAQRGQEWNV